MNHGDKDPRFDNVQNGMEDKLMTFLTEMNNTGVYENFACAAGPVVVPKGFKPVAKNETWKVFETRDSLLIEYNIDAPKDKWVLKAVDGKPLDRDYDNWPLIDGKMN